MSNQNDMSDYTAESPAREAWRMFRRNIPALVGVFILAVIILLTLYGQFFYTGDAFDIVWAPHERPGVTPGFPSEQIISAAISSQVCSQGAERHLRSVQRLP